MMLSEHCAAALDAIDAHPEPTYEQLREVLASHRELLACTRTFAERMETAKASHAGKVPMFAAAGAATNYYHGLLDAEPVRAVVTAVVIAFPGRRV